MSSEAIWYICEVEEDARRRYKLYFCVCAYSVMYSFKQVPIRYTFISTQVNTEVIYQYIEH